MIDLSWEVVLVIDSEGIYRAANAAVRFSESRNPFQIARDRGIKVCYSGDFGNLLGMYTCKWKHRIIILNNRLDDYMMKMVCAHELGHDVFHRDLAKDDGIQEFVLFNMINHTEYEANAYAAHVLLDDDRVYSLAREGYDVVQMARKMGSNVNLMLIKMQEMNKLGYDFRIPFDADSTFFKKIHQ